MQKGVPDLWSYPLSDSVDRDGSGLSIHARASPELEPSRTTSPRVYKSPWSSSHRGQPALVSTEAPRTRDDEDNLSPRLQQFLDPESSRATGPRVCNRSFCLRHHWTTSPSIYQGNFALNLNGTTSSTGSQISPFSSEKKDQPSRHALQNQSTTHGTYEGNRPTCPHGSSSSAGG